MHKNRLTATKNTSSLHLVLQAQVEAGNRHSKKSELNQPYELMSLLMLDYNQRGQFLSFSHLAAVSLSPFLLLVSLAWIALFFYSLHPKITLYLNLIKLMLN
jgi:hypothetical protein